MSSPRKKKSLSKGFTLIEVLIAVLILATGLVLVIEAMGKTQQAIGVSQNVIVATQLAEQKWIEKEMEAIDTHKLRSSSDGGKQKDLGRDFEWSRQVSPFQHETIKDETKLNQIDVTVSWPERGGKSELKIASLVMNQEKK